MSVVERYNLKEVINVSGTMTAIGASSVPPEVAEAMVEILPRFIDMNDLQAKASAIISRVIGSEAGIVTASAASGIANSIAASMTGSDLHLAEVLPDATGTKDEVIIQRGHMAWYGASVGQLARLTGAKLVEVGDATRAGRYQFRGAITERTAAALYVTSHHTVQYGLINLRDFCEVAHEHGVPVIVDAASESEMRTFIEAGADLTCFSGHKFLAGPTSGIIAGREDLVRACLMHQHAGIGRPMKVGKESIVGAMVALERWEGLDHDKVHDEMRDIIRILVGGLEDLEGVSLRVEPDPTGNPIDRVKVMFEPVQAGFNAFEVAEAMKRNDPPIIVRDHHAIDEGFIFLDPCNVDAEKAQYVVKQLRGLLELPDDKKWALRSQLPTTPNDADLQEQGLRAWSASEGREHA